MTGPVRQEPSSASAATLTAAVECFTGNQDAVRTISLTIRIDRSEIDPIDHVPGGNCFGAGEIVREVPPPTS